MSSAATTLAEIVSKIASQGKNPDVSFLKDNPEAQTMLLMALLSSTANNNNNNNNKSPVAPPSKLDTDKRKYDSFSSPTSSPSPSRDDLEAPRRVGRKPVTSEEEDSDNPKSKRKAQNRAAQRAFRERKENHVRILEDRVKELEELNSDKNSKLLVENEKLKDMITRLQNENAALLSSSVSFDYPLSSLGNGESRPQKIIRSSTAANTGMGVGAAEASPVAYFDSFSSSYSTSSKSRSNTPETQQHKTKSVSIDDILGLDNSTLPSDALLDHSELLGLNNTNNKIDYSTQLDDMLNQHRLTFSTDPSQFDFFYPLEVTNNNDILDTASIQIPPKEEEDLGAKHLADITHVWEKVSQHPRFDEIDMDLLCDEMKEKATCYEMNPDKEIKKALDKYYPIN